MIDKICKSLGIPKRILVGGEFSGLSTELREFERVRLDELREKVGKPLVLKTLERAMPELFWEPMFLMSPRGRILKRRPLPKVVWE